MIDEETKGKDSDILLAYLLLKRIITLIPGLSNKQQYDEALDDLKMQVKQLPNYIKNLGVPMIEKYLTEYFNQISKDID